MSSVMGFVNKGEGWLFSKATCAPFDHVNGFSLDMAVAGELEVCYFLVPDHVTEAYGKVG